MRVAHLLRKCNPNEWAGTETAVQRLLGGLRHEQVASVVYCPSFEDSSWVNPLTADGWPLRRFKACVPIWGISERKRRELVSVGGNLVSFDLFPALLHEQPLDVIHTHTLGRLGASALRVAQRRGVPLVISIHGGVADLPESVRRVMNTTSSGGLEWGKLVSLLLRAYRLLDEADAIITCNERETTALQRQHPRQRILTQQHGIPARLFSEDRRHAARAAFPQICDRPVLLSLGRIYPVKNQGWLVEQMPAILRQHPDVLLVLAGPCTHEDYGEALKQRIEQLGLTDRVLLTGGLPAEDARLIGLLQEARALLLPSISETFGLVILEAWAAGTPVIASRTSGALSLIRPGANGWLFDLEDPATFHQAVAALLSRPDAAQALGAAGRDTVRAQFDATILARRVLELYQQLIAEKHALRNSAG